MLANVSALMEKPVDGPYSIDTDDVLLPVAASGFLMS